MNDCTIDILLAVYNGEKYIKEQIQSILRQTYSNLHIIVRDNCSEDRTKEIVQEMIEAHPGKITLITSEKNLGVVGNFASLLDLTRSSYAMFADCDDVWFPEKIEKSLKEMHHFEFRYGTDVPILIHSDLKVVDIDLNVIHDSFWRYSYLKPSQGKTLGRQLVQNAVTGCTILMNRALIERSRPIPEGVVMHDWWIGIVAAALGKIGIVNEPLMLYRQHGKNDTGAKKYDFLHDFKLKEPVLTFRSKCVNQATFCLQRFETVLTQKQRKTLRAYIGLHQAPLFKQAYLALRYGLYKHGALRNLNLFFLFFRKLISMEIKP
jgi:glycosyltransferase involved in cell wall biosynthesis